MTAICKPDVSQMPLLSLNHCSLRQLPLLAKQHKTLSAVWLPPVVQSCQHLQSRDAEARFLQQEAEVFGHQHNSTELMVMSVQSIYEHMVSSCSADQAKASIAFTVSASLLPTRL